MELRIVDKSLGSKTGSNGNGNGNGNGNSKRRNAPGSYERGELIHFAQLSSDATAIIERERSLREMSLKINRSQEAERLQITQRLHSVMVRSLELTNLNAVASVPLPEAVADGASNGKSGHEVASVSSLNGRAKARKTCAKVDQSASVEDASLFA